ncbi:MAG: hypothetical protein IJA35_01555 [Clostridia bacterium]|nr:hypothetical protein [Clostridia bacterium]
MITVKEVKTRSDMRRFVTFPHKLYKDNPNYMPALQSDDYAEYDPKKNPSYSFCDAKCFIALKEGKVVGRIAAIHNKRANKKFGNRRMRFTSVDFIDDYEVSTALFNAAEGFARELGCTEIHGPLGFTDLDREGMLVEGFDREGQFITYYNHPYYIDHLTKLGYVKDIDWIEYRITTPDKPIELLKKLSERALRSGKLKVLDITKKSQVRPLIKKVFNLINETYDHLYGQVGLDETQINMYAEKFIPLINFDYTCFIEDTEGKLVAFGIAAPSLGKAMKKSSGRMFPFGAFRLLHALKHNDTLDLFLIGVHPDLQGSAVNAIILNKVMNSAIKNGIKFAETGPELETNTAVVAQWKLFEREQHKRRRCFIKAL